MGVAARYPRWQKADAEAHAQAIGGTVKFEPKHTSNEWGPTSIGIYYVFDKPPQGSAGGGGIQPKAQTPPPPSPVFNAAQATSAFQPQVSTSHVGLSRGPVEQGDTIPERAGMFLGINTAVPETQLRAGESPWCKNIQGARPLGAMSFRRGVMKLKMNRDTVTDASIEAATITCGTKANVAASTDYYLFTKPNGDTHAFWFDTTGADSEPAGSVAADASTAVDISADTTAAEVAERLRVAINAATIGLAGTINPVTPTVIALATTTAPWFLNEFVTHASFTVTDFVVAGGAALNAAYGGASAEPLEGANYDGDSGMLLTFQRTRAAYIGETSTDLLCVVTKQSPLHGRQRSLENVGGMTMTLSGGGGILQATVAHPRGGAYGEVVAVTIRYSTRGFPLDVDGNDDNSRASGSDAIDPTAASGFFTNADRGAWDGTSLLFVGPTPVASPTFYYVTAWAHSREGTSLPVKGTITIT